MDNKLVIINTDNIEVPKEGDNLYSTRINVNKAFINKSQPIVTVVVTSYNRLTKTKACVESILKYTQEISYKLLLVDNGSTDGTLEYYNNIQYNNKQIVRVTKNLGLSFANKVILENLEGNYFAFVSNDVIVTKNWLHNLIKCAQSDPKIGMVNPCASNISNLQELPLYFNSEEEMHEKAAKNNISDPSRWHERLRLVTLGFFLTRECLNTIGLLNDLGFFHDFGDDDIAFRVRRAGYKTILAKDVWIHHDHDFRNLEDKDPTQFQKSLQKGRENFRNKYLGIDAWDDINNYETTMIELIQRPENTDSPKVLGINIRCGTPILEVKNKLRELGIFNAELSAFFQEAKYYIDLKTICEGQVKCDRVEFILDHFQEKYFDYIVLGEPINLYAEPQKLLQKILKLLKPKGQLLLKLKNTFGFNTMLNILGNFHSRSDELFLHISLETLISWFEMWGLREMNINIEAIQIPEDNLKFVEYVAEKLSQNEDIQQVVNRILTDNYVISIK